MATLRILPKTQRIFLKKIAEANCSAQHSVVFGLDKSGKLWANAPRVSHIHRKEIGDVAGRSMSLLYGQIRWGRELLGGTPWNVQVATTETDTGIERHVNVESAFMFLVPCSSPCTNIYVCVGTTTVARHPCNICILCAWLRTSCEASVCVLCNVRCAYIERIMLLSECHHLC